MDIKKYFLNLAKEEINKNIAFANKNNKEKIIQKTQEAFANKVKNKINIISELELKEKPNNIIKNIYIASSLYKEYPDKHLTKIFLYTDDEFIKFQRAINFKDDDEKDEKIQSVMIEFLKQKETTIQEIIAIWSEMLIFIENYYDEIIN